MNRLQAMQRRLRQLCLGVACVLLFSIMLIGGADVLASNLFNAPLPVVLELSETLLAASVFLALAAAGGAGQHITVDVLIERIGDRGRQLSAALASAVGLVVFTIMAWCSWGLALDSVATMEAASALIRFPVWPAKLLAAAGVTLAATQCAADLLAPLLSRQR